MGGLMDLQMGLLTGSRREHEKDFQLVYSLECPLGLSMDSSKESPLETVCTEESSTYYLIHP